MLTTTLLADALTRDDLIRLEEPIIPNFAGLNLSRVFTGGTAGIRSYNLITLLFWIAGTLLLIYLVMGGFKLMTSAGDPKKAAGAKQTITNAFLGMIIVFFAYWIVQIFTIMLGLDQNVF